MWQDILLHADADEWAYEINYTEEDLLNALYIFNHIGLNIAIKRGYVNKSNAEEVGRRFKQLVLENLGFDTVDLTNRVLNNINNESSITSQTFEE
jgi:hypothetical protein